MLLLLPLTGLLGLRLLEILRAPLRGLGDPEYDDSEFPRLGGGGRPLRGDIDLELERRGLLIGERLRCRGGGGDLLGGLLGRLGGDRLLGGRGDRLRTGLPRPLLGEIRAGDLCLRSGEGERLLRGEGGLRRGDASLRRFAGESTRLRTGDSTRRRGEESGRRLGETTLLFGGDRLRGGERGFLFGEVSLGCGGASFSAGGPTLSLGGASFFGAAGTAFIGEEAFWRCVRVNLTRMIHPSI